MCHSCLFSLITLSHLWNQSSRDVHSPWTQAAPFLPFTLVDRLLTWLILQERKSWMFAEQRLFSPLYLLSLQNPACLSHLTAKLIFQVCPFLTSAIREVPCFFQISGYTAQVLPSAQLTHCPSPKQLTQIERMTYKDQTNAELWARSRCLKAVNTLAGRNTETFGPPRYAHQKALRWMLPSPPSSTAKEKWWSDFFLRLTWHCSIKHPTSGFWKYSVR